MPASAAGTAEFITAFDKIFDCLNSSSVKSAQGKLYRRALSDSSAHLKFLTDEAIPFLKLSLKSRLLKLLIEPLGLMQQTT